MIVLKVDDRLELRQLQESDAALLFDVIVRNRTYLRDWMPWLDITQRPEDTLLFIRTTIQQADNGDGFVAGIWNDNLIVGTIGFQKVDWLNRNVEIGYWISADCQGKGIVTRACKAFIDHAFNEWQLHRVQIRCATGNLRSCKIPERLGFTREGHQRQAEFLYGRYVDLIIYGMLADEWKEQRLRIL